MTNPQTRVSSMSKNLVKKVKKNLGEVKALYRFPVKSMGGESLNEVYASEKGLAYDRTWATYHEDKREIQGAKKIPGLMQFSARYVDTPAVEQNKAKMSSSAQISPAVIITSPQGDEFCSDDPNCSETISKILGENLTLSELKPLSDKQHYKLARRMNDKQLRKLLGLADDEPTPDFSEMPVSMLLKLQQFSTYPGTYFDAYPIHIMTTSSLEEMKKITGNNNFQVDRFRPNIFIDSLEPGFTELNWCHQKIKIGEVILQIDGRTPRCSMPARAQNGLIEDPQVTRQLFKLADRNLGIYANVIQNGVIKSGDQVELLEDNDHQVVKAAKNAQRKIKKQLINLFS